MWVGGQSQLEETKTKGLNICNSVGSKGAFNSFHHFTPENDLCIYNNSCTTGFKHIKDIIHRILNVRLASARRLGLESLENSNGKGSGHSTKISIESLGNDKFRIRYSQSKAFIMPLFLRFELLVIEINYKLEHHKNQGHQITSHLPEASIEVLTSPSVLTQIIHETLVNIRAAYRIRKSLQAVALVGIIQWCTVPVISAGPGSTEIHLSAMWSSPTCPTITRILLQRTQQPARGPVTTRVIVTCTWWGHDLAHRSFITCKVPWKIL